MTGRPTLGAPGTALRMCLLGALLATLPIAGCGYTVRPPYEPTVRTVYVPVFRSLSFRRDLNLQLTELVQKEIERRTPFKVVGSPEGADTTLEGIVSFVEKNIKTENPNNLPRELIGAVTVRVRWIDNRTGAVAEREVEAPTVPVVEVAPFYPELGETTQLAYYKVMDRLSRDIVDMMEEPW